MNKPTFKEICLMHMQQLTNFPYIEKDFDALTDYGLLCKIVEKLNEVITNQNTTNESIIQMYNAFNTLKDYIDNYFDNLDVQEEINNKLDEMAENGELTALIKAYVDPIYQEYENSINSVISSQNNRITGIETQVQAVASGSPLVATSTSKMTDTTKIYVNTTDGKWYYYDGDSWEIGGTYQSSGISSNYISPLMLNNDTKEIIKTKIPELTIVEGEYVRFNNTIAELSNTYRSEPFLIKKGETIVLNAKGYAQNVGMISECNPDKSNINVVQLSIDNSLRKYSYTALNDTYIMISYLYGNASYYIYEDVPSNYFNNVNYSLTNYNNLLTSDDLNYRQVTHKFTKTNDMYINESIITVNTQAELHSTWNWSVFRNFDVSSYNINTKITGVIDIKNNKPVEVFLLNNSYTPISKTIIPASSKYQRVIINGLIPSNNSIIRLCIGSQKEEAQENSINIRLFGLFIDQENSLVYSNPLTFNDLKYIMQVKNVYNYSSFSIIGDSYSAYKGWIPNDGRWSWYKPEGNTEENDVSSVTQMWWYKLADMINATLLYLDGWSGSTICTTGYNGSDVSTSAMVNRVNDSLGVERVLEAKPQLIFIFGGTNDSWMNSPVGSVKYSDWTTNDLKSVLPAFCKMVDTIKTYNPGARIINIINSDIKSTIKDGMETACKHYNIESIEPLNISKENGHPNQAGMLSIAQQIFNIL